MAAPPSSSLIAVLLASTCLLVPVLGDCRDGWTKFQESCYLFASDQASWPEAAAFCVTMNSNLVEIESATENAFIEGELKIIHGHDSHAQNQNEVSYWLGGNDLEVEGTFKWARSGESVTFTDWNPGQPDDFHSGEDCMELQGAMDYHWNDLPCTARHRFICESPVTDEGAISNVIG
ncbi:echinoidin-like [Ostrea edulis]|uniref:echinoidin-like n=1 Tax=Ostrea edulis TaxID=37623 RepID=UPI0024AFB979|nr:echinoidin-like [Ostrea edulis]